MYFPIPPLQPSKTGEPRQFSCDIVLPLHMTRCSLQIAQSIYAFIGRSCSVHWAILTLYFIIQPWHLTRNLPWASKSWTSKENSITSIFPPHHSLWTTVLVAHWALHAALLWHPPKNTTPDLPNPSPHSISILQLAPPLSSTSRNPRSILEPKNKTLKLHHLHFHPLKSLGIAKYGRASSNSRREPS